MAGWTKALIGFSVLMAPGVQTRTSLCHIPKPVLKSLDNPPGLTFVFAGDGRTMVRVGQDGELLR